MAEVMDGARIALTDEGGAFVAGPMSASVCFDASEFWISESVWFHRGVLQSRAVGIALLNRAGSVVAKGPLHRPIDPGPDIRVEVVSIRGDARLLELTPSLA